jgi:glycosyltransferase involved in cell wall biosynthesis
LLVILEAGTALPSGMARGLIYRERFEAEGVSVTYVNRMPAAIARILLNPPRWLKPIMRVGGSFALRALNRLCLVLAEWRILASAARYDVIYMVKVTSCSFVERLRRRTRARLVADFVDAVWQPAYRIAQFSELLAAVDAVTTDNELTATYMRGVTARPCHVIQDTPQLECFDRRRHAVRKADGDVVTIGWIGSPGTAYNLYVVWEALEWLSDRHAGVQVRLVGTGPDLRILPRFENVRFSTVASYSQAEMIDEVLQMDIGLFPLQNTTASRVRGILKACIYMAAEAAVVASPVGQSDEFIIDGVNGCKATSTEDWKQALERLVVDAAQRRRIAAEGLKTVRERFTLEHSFRQLRSVLFPSFSPIFPTR